MDISHLQVNKDYIEVNRANIKYHFFRFSNFIFNHNYFISNHLIFFIMAKTFSLGSRIMYDTNEQTATKEQELRNLLTIKN